MPLVILDRDGVINQDSDAFVKSPEEWLPISGSIEAIAELCKAGFQVAIATNQSGIARGYFTLETLTAMHNKMEQLVNQAGGSITAIAYCPHGPDDNCVCRKPKPGLIYQLKQQLQFTPQDTWVVGDSLRDLQAAAAAGCKPALVTTGKGQNTLKKLAELSYDVPVYKNLAEFTSALLKQVQYK
ncbi:D-glycero-beta-D-manno-heptose 1,7-bisphosphate 7-phosphatase [Endozoicomonas sp. SM1973]|uniref:D,D-heptose 1,7-bisphosphate phosphatase n=1 Tax=Spartinivicinus marinus TaxID=2994442 RepID=A0A853I2F7_9GAMM|nr:D-glycero-beta-D-manno-heptose 1,7-bisphosphate 7-phosphatase [Spartinivicinus marinus]MCX4026865.1 D-glycero-beta-D-manno-heptose 1,7-bisphosphate 7-phosphatase [Spartinivicinus marinus]NYZ66789.1 D-glycero-beta-D-manno-heptose 1,7-bisphosphate 7-phosphatase [Spartinivicinus marinus]